MEENKFCEKTQTLIAIGAATAANCIPCFEHLYEKAITTGITGEEISKAAEIAANVKNGAHKAVSGVVEELTGSQENGCLSCGRTADGSC
ncbi:MAG: carboxymuconolactone decarboxylase family protein [Desulfarculaceae bacterium]|nr:carboxymuconolactone decarboxylase family protein [Desulfarculaceae bacterium]MCF8049561.1 carboxymuconolactone decarboxylase family protein [Desulfarculaceae bacterium]MCF8066842.1 carboxymuconolactone decarboxylase family protein [Desulfarculaceae bacterium]MCF8099939.1 carboxymuconolactone decarboxylase family protein [Desulfarculaceae bacterium]